MPPALSLRPAGDGVTFMFLYSVCLIEGADLALLPATFRALEVSFGLTPSDLASLGLAQALMLSICAPIWGILADNGWPRKWLLVGGACAWGLITVQLAIVTDFSTMLVLRALNGCALATLSPISQSIIADLTPSGERGSAFGLVQASTSVGMMFGLVFAASISNEVFFNTEGWRIAFGSVGALSLLLSALMAVFMTEPGRDGNDSPRGAINIWDEVTRLRLYWRIDTFKVIVLQGLFGTIPWSALAFGTMYFQYQGMSDFRASVLSATMMVGMALGGILGGVIGDALTRWSRFHGRPLTAQISSFSGIPLVALLFNLPEGENLFVAYFGLIFLFGLLASWCGVGVNRPILTEIVSSQGRASILAWVIALDGSVAAVCGAPVVGLLSERYFGYEPNDKPVSAMPVADRQANAAALSKAMMCCTILPWSICFAFYTLLHYTYKADCLEVVDAPNDAPTQRLSTASSIRLISKDP